LEKDPEKRPASAAVLQTRLQGILLPTPWTRERAEQWWSSHAPEKTSTRPVAEVVLSEEARPVQVLQGRR
jgi:hypothetical protein